MLPIYTIPDKIDDQIIEWISWNYSENINEQHLLFLRHLSAIKFGILNNKEYYIIQDSEFTPVPNTTIAIEYLKDHIPKNIDLIFLSHYGSQNSKSITNENIYTTKNEDMSDLKCYLISNKYAKTLIKLYDKPFYNIKNLNITLDLLIYGGNYLVSIYLLFYKNLKSNHTLYQQYKQYYQQFYQDLLK